MLTWSRTWAHCGAGDPVPWSEAEQVGGYQPSRYGVDGQGGLFQADHAQQAGLACLGEYHGGVELQSLQPYPESTERRLWGQSLKKPEGAPLNLG